MRMGMLMVVSASALCAASSVPDHVGADIDPRYKQQYQPLVDELIELIEGEEEDFKPLLARLGAHTFMTFREGWVPPGGSNGGCVLHEPSKSDPGNANLEPVVDQLHLVKESFPFVSSADLFILAGNLGMELMGSPSLYFRPGRVDYTAEEAAKYCPEGRLPNKSEKDAFPHLLTQEVLIERFGDYGFNPASDPEGYHKIVAIMGAHSIGQMHRNTSKQAGAFTSKPFHFDNEYYKNLVGFEWRTGSESRATGPLAHDELQYEEECPASMGCVNDTLVMLPVDIALKHSPILYPIVVEFAADEQSFRYYFKLAWDSMAEANVNRPVLPEGTVLFRGTSNGWKGEAMVFDTHLKLWTTRQVFEAPGAELLVDLSGDSKEKYPATGGNYKAEEGAGEYFVTFDERSREVKAVRVTPLWTEAFLRGTDSQWGATEMQWNGKKGVWTVAASFPSPGAEFKISRTPSSYEPGRNVVLREGEGVYDVQFNDVTGETVVKRASPSWQEPPVFRGTPNSWGSTPMVWEEGAWRATVVFASTDRNEFKIDRHGDWKEAFPASNYRIPVPGAYVVSFNDVTKIVSAQKTAAYSYVPARFSCHQGQTTWGQSVYVVGSIHHLGTWNLDQAVKLEPTSYPTWTGTITVPAGVVIEWKCVKRSEDTPVTRVEWQQGRDNKFKAAFPGADVEAYF